MKKILLFWTMVLFLSLAIVLPAGAEQGRIFHWEDIPQEGLTADGLARVIVVFDVPKITELTLSSTTAKASYSTKAYLHSSPNNLSDTALKNAIENAADQVLNRLKPSKRSTFESHSLNRRYDFLPLLAMEVSQSTLGMLLSDLQVKAVFPDVPMALPNTWTSMPTQTGNVPYSPFSDPDGAIPSSNEEVMELIGADEAWNNGYTGKGWYVAILDTGIRNTHEYFKGKDIVEACFSNRGDCPNESIAMTGPDSAAHLTEDFAGHDHGTHVAGIAAGSNPSGPAFGVAKDAGIVAVNVFSAFSKEECGGDSPCVMSYSSDQLAGLVYIYSLRNNYNIGAVNMSLGGGRYEDFCDDKNNYPLFMAINLLQEASISVPIASGNETFCGYTGTPACISTAITVMASTMTDMEAKFNNWDLEIGDIFAPGQKILSSVGSSDTDYEEWSGTSMATPFVTGAITLMRQVRPKASDADLLIRLTALGPSITTPCADGGSKPRLYVDNFGLDQNEKAQLLFDLMEAQYPELLLPQPAVTQQKNGYIYRYYSETGIYLGIKDDKVYYYVDQDGELIEMGSIDSFLSSFANG